MERSIWCFNCKRIMNTIVRDDHEVCQKCEKHVSRSSGGDASVVTEDGASSD